MLIMGGYLSLGKQEIEMYPYGSLYYHYFSKSIDVRYCSVETEYEASNHIKTYTELKFTTVYLVYIGHGEGMNGRDYPNAMPGESFDIVGVNMKNVDGITISFRVIFNCCNMGSSALAHPPATAPNARTVVGVEKFLSMDFRYICVVRGLQDSVVTEENHTLFGKSIMDTVVNFQFDDISDFLSLLNFKFGMAYKADQGGRSIRMKKFISCSEGFSCTWSKTVVEEHQNSDIVEMPLDYFIEENQHAKEPYVDHHARNGDTRTVFGKLLNAIPL